MKTFFDARNYPKIKLMDFDGKEAIVPATLTAGSEALAGTALLAKYELRINFPHHKIILQKS